LRFQRKWIWSRVGERTIVTIAPDHSGRIEMRLYSGPVSLFTAKVRIALDEKAIAYERVEVGWSRSQGYAPHHPDVVALNPKHQVPVLVDGDTVVYDSTLILEYLEERSPTPALYPSGLAERARCRQLEAFADEILFPPVWQLISQGVYGAGDPDVGATARETLGALAESLDKQLTGRAWLCDAFSVADIATFVMLSAASTLGAPVPECFENLRGWLARVAARPAVAADTRSMIEFFLSH
jgi:glutathione S-transferase